MIIGLISDTHDNVPNILKAIEIFKERKPDFIIHCGDIISPTSLEYFKGLKMKVVFGNCNGPKDKTNNVAKMCGWEEVTETKEFEVDAKNFFVCHGHRKDLLQAKIDSGEFDYVIHGHTHQARNEKIGNTRVINPGGHYLGIDRKEHSIAFLDVKKDGVEFIKGF